MRWLDGRAVRFIGDSPAIAAALERHGARLDEAVCDALIYVAPPPPQQPTHALRHDQWRQTLDAGLDQPFFHAKAFAEQRRAVGKGGAILYVCAPEQILGGDQAAAAGGLGNLTKTLGVEWARDGIRVNAIMTTDASETLGNLAAYLVSDYAAYITGAVMGVGVGDI